MLCEECGEETMESYYKLRNGDGLMVCRDCKGFKGQGNPLAPRPMKSGMLKGF
jgi:hypothetical protein